MNKCTDCGSEELGYYKHELCCRNCGLVIDDFQLVHDYDYNTHSAVFPNTEASTKGQTQYAIKTDKEHINQIFTILKKETQDEEMYNVISSMMKDYEEILGKGFKGRNRYLISSVCIYTMFEKYYDTHTFPMLLSIDRNVFLKELTKYKSFSKHKNNSSRGSVELEHRSKMNASIFKQIASLSLSEEMKQSIIKTSFRIYDKIETNIQLFSDFIIEKISASIIWMAIKIMNNKTTDIKIKLREYCDYMGVSSATILKVNNRIKEVLLKTT